MCKKGKNKDVSVCKRGGGRGEGSSVCMWKGWGGGGEGGLKDVDRCAYAQGGEGEAVTVSPRAHVYRLIYFKAR